MTGRITNYKENHKNDDSDSEKMKNFTIKGDKKENGKGQIKKRGRPPKVMNN